MAQSGGVDCSEGVGEGVEVAPVAAQEHVERKRLLRVPQLQRGYCLRLGVDLLDRVFLVLQFGNQRLDNAKLGVVAVDALVADLVRDDSVRVVVLRLLAAVALS